MEFREREWDIMDEIHLALNGHHGIAVMNTVMNLLVP
jgi:hypothetical protein